MTAKPAGKPDREGPDREGPGRGGRRPGSGRPKKPPQELKINSTIRLTPRAAEYLRLNRCAIQAELEERASSHEKTAPPAPRIVDAGFE